MPNQFLPQLPSLSRPSWAPAGMSAETIADIQSRPDQLRRYRSGANRQINFSGSLLPKPPALTGGEVFADGSVPGNGLGGGNGNYQDIQPVAGAVPQAIPMNARQQYAGDINTWEARRQNRDPNLGPRPIDPDAAAPGSAAPVVAQTPWFSQPWGAASQETDLPYWMKGQNGRR